jgi:hypothetical protein
MILKDGYKHKLDSLQHFVTKITELRTFISANRVANVDPETWENAIGFFVDSWRNIYYATKKAVVGNVIAVSSSTSGTSSNAVTEGDALVGEDDAVEGNGRSEDVDPHDDYVQYGKDLIETWKNDAVEREKRMNKLEKELAEEEEDEVLNTSIRESVDDHCDPSEEVVNISSDSLLDTRIDFRHVDETVMETGTTSILLLPAASSDVSATATTVHDNNDDSTAIRSLRPARTRHAPRRFT